MLISSPLKVIGGINVNFKEGEAMKRSFNYSLFCFVFLFVTLIYVTSFASTDSAVMRIANVTSSNEPSSEALSKFKESVEKSTNGKIKVKIFNDGVLGSETETRDLVVRGEVESVLMHGLQILGRMKEPEFAFQALPFVFQTREMAYRAFDGELGEYVKERMEKKGIVVLAYGETGFRHFTNNRSAIIKPRDMDGLKFRSSASPIRLDMYGALGTNAIPMAFTELYTALQQGTVDGQDNPLSIIYSSKLYEVQKYLSLSGHIWGPAPFLVNKAWWDKIDEENQDKIRKAAVDSMNYLRQLVRESDEGLAAKLREKGMKINEVDAKLFVEAVQPVWKKWEPKIGQEVMGMVRKLQKGE